MSSGLNYSAIQSKKKLQPFVQTQQQQQLLLQGGIQPQTVSSPLQQGFASQSSQNTYNSIINTNNAQNGQTTQSQGNSAPYLYNYYFGSVTNQNISGNQQQLQYQIFQQNQNTNKLITSSSSPKSFFGQSSSSYINTNSYLDNSLNSKSKINTNQSINSSYSSQQQQQTQQSQQLAQQQPQTQQQQISSQQQLIQSQTPQNQPYMPVSQSQQINPQNQSSDPLFSPNSQVKNKKLFVNTNNNFYLSSLQNTQSATNVKQSVNLASQSTLSSSSSREFNVNKRDLQKQQRSPPKQTQQSTSLINQSGLNSLSNNSPSTIASVSGLNQLNNSDTLNSSDQGNGIFNLNNSNRSFNSNNSQSISAPNSDEQRFIKKTQHFVRGLTSQSGTWNGNNQEEIEDLNESVIEMMKEFNLYDQAQKGIIPDADPTKFSVKRNGIVSCYAAKTHQGLVRNYNEDRVSIILNIMKPQNRQSDEQWPKCSFFGVYDGHGGVNCADFLRDHLHQYVIKDSNFPWNPKEAIKNGFEQAEIQFLRQAQAQLNKGGQIDRSGSCALVVLIVGDTCYVANVGDSRAVMSSDGGKNISALTRDHKPMDEVENQRIHDNGGKVYQTKIQSIAVSDRNGEDPQTIVGPYRVLPGRLSVTRTFGDIEAKFPRYGGNPKVVVATPEIKSFKIQPNHDFIVLGCDGIYDKITSQEIGQIAWDTSKNETLGESVHEFSGKSVENIMKLSVARKTLDNITVVMIGFDNLEQILFDKSSTKQQEMQSPILGSLASNDYIQHPSLTSNTSPLSQPQSLSISQKSQKLLQSISQSASTSQAQYGLSHKNMGIQQTSINDKQKLTQANSLNQQQSSKTNNYLSLNNNYLNQQNTIVPLSEKDSNLDNKEQQQLTSSTYQLGSSSRTSITNPSKKNSYDEPSSNGLKSSLLMNKTGNIPRSKMSQEYSASTISSHISPLYQSQQFSSQKQLKQSNVISPSHGSQSKILGGITQSTTSEPKFRPSLIKNVSTK